MENKSHALAAGAFVLLVSLLLAGLGLWLTRDRTVYQLYELSSRESVTGLQSQAAVRYKGVAVGKVERIGFDPQTPGNILIRIAVNTDAPITSTTFATLGYQGVTGLAHILLDDASSALPALPAGPGGLPQLPLQSSPLSQLAEQGPLIMGQVQEALGRVNQLLSDDKLQDFGQALNHLGQAASNVNQLTARLQTTVTQHLNPALASLPALAQEAQSTLHALRSTSSQTNNVLQQAGSSLQTLNAPDGALRAIGNSANAMTQVAERFGRSTLPRLNQAADDTGRAARQLGRATAGISEQPQALLYGNGAIPPGPGEPGFSAPPAR